MWFQQGMLRISWTAKKLQEADTTRSLMNRMSKRQANFFGSLMRREKLEHLVIT